MKKAGINVIALIFCRVCLAQAILPTYWSFDGSTPEGWVTSGTSFYTSSAYSVNIPSCKFDNTGDYVMIHFKDTPDTLSYYLRGANFSGGIFTIEQSPDSLTWTALRTITSPDNSNMIQYTDIPAKKSCYIRFYYTSKQTGNIALDEISLTADPNGPGPEININYQNNQISSGSTIFFSSLVGETTTLSVQIKNPGNLNTLILNNISLTGYSQNDFLLTSFPTSIDPFDAKDITIQFTPSEQGTRNATLFIENNDADENPYLVHLNGIGGKYASEPVEQPSGLIFSNVKSYRFKTLFHQLSNPPDGYLVLIKKDSPITEFPEDGVIYQKGDAIGNAKVVCVGKDTSFIPSFIVANTTYYVAVFAYNGTANYINYLQNNPLQASVKSLASMQGNYYEGISSASPDFIQALHNKINPHTQILYNDYISAMINKFESRDTSQGERTVTCVYSGENYVYTEPFDWSVYSREHTFPFSWMPTYPDNKGAEYSDFHNLFPANLAKANSPRSNHPFGIVKDPIFQYVEGTLGKDANGNIVYEPRNAHKGDAARAMLYMTICYDGIGGKRWFLPQQQNQDILKLWHWQDPPDNWEIARNDFIDSLQGNRNPFIDSTQFVCFIDFHTLMPLQAMAIPCLPNSINEKDKTFSSPKLKFSSDNNQYYLSFSSSKKESANLAIFNIKGQLVHSEKLSLAPGNHEITLNTESFAQGLYTVKLNFDGESQHFLKLSNFEIP